MKKIIAITMVKNEMDVIESFVRHTLGFADRLLVADHMSSDRTREILDKLIAEGVPIEVQELRETAYMQAEVRGSCIRRRRSTARMSSCRSMRMSFSSIRGGISVRSVLESIPEDAVFSVHWRQYVPREPEADTEKFLLARPLWRKNYLDSIQKVIVGGGLVRAKELWLRQGNHEVFCERAGGYYFEKDTFLEDLEIAHFPWRSSAQWQSKRMALTLNGAAKYTFYTIMGITPLPELEKVCVSPQVFDFGKDEWEAWDFSGKESLPALRYSAKTQPNVLANTLHVAMRLAEELAEERAREEQHPVTTVIPFLGRREPFLVTLGSALREEYPAHEICLLALAGEFSKEAVRETLAAAGTAASTKTVRVFRGKMAFDELAREAGGELVEWLLPGETVRPEKLRHMAASLIQHTRELPVTMILSDAGETDYSLASPYLDIGSTENQFVLVPPNGDLWEFLLPQGGYPSRGLAGLLMRRSVLDACGWLSAGFAHVETGYVSPLRLWCLLLTARPKSGMSNLYIFHENFAGPLPEARLADWAMDRLAWHHLLAEDTLLTEEQQAEARENERETGIALLERALASGEDMKQPVWQEYQRILMEL